MEGEKATLEIKLPKELEPLATPEAVESIREKIMTILRLMKRHVENGVSPNLAFRMAIQDYLFEGDE